MSVKTYVLLPHLWPTAPIFQQVNKDQRIQLRTLPQWHPYLRYTFLDESEETTDYDSESKTFGQKIPNKWKGKNRTARLKLISNTPWQDEQIEKEKISANEKPSDTEREAVKFIHNVLVTANPVVQRYLEVIPEMKGFKGRSEDVRQASYDIYDENVEIETENKNFLKRLEAANKIAKLNLEEAQNLLLRIYGSFFVVPQKLSLAQNALVNYMDESDEALDDILKEDTNLDDEIQVLIGRLVSEGKLSFDAVEGQVVKKKNDGWINLKAISNEYTPLERQRYFTEFLTSEAGKLLLEDLRAEVGVKEKTKSKKETVTK